MNPRATFLAGILSSTLYFSTGLAASAQTTVVEVVHGLDIGVLNSQLLIPALAPDFFEGWDPYAQQAPVLTRGADGHLYGLGRFEISRDPAYFRIDPEQVHVFGGDEDSIVKNLHVPASPSSPFMNLTLGADNLFYGIRATGPDEYGIVRIGEISGGEPNYQGYLATDLVVYDGTEACQPNNLTLGTDGSFYGVDTEKGAHGAVANLTTNGVLTVLHLFNGADGSRPAAPLLLGSDGNLYGTTQYGGASGRGTVFKITPSGDLTTLHSFTSVNGSMPSMGMLVEKDGFLFGFTLQGGADGFGETYKLALDGSSFDSFSYSYLRHPIGGLVKGTNGLMYGVVQQGGDHGFGAVFYLGADGTVTVLHSFEAGIENTPGPTSGLTLHDDGALYGLAKFTGHPDLLDMPSEFRSYNTVVYRVFEMHAPQIVSQPGENWPAQDLAWGVMARGGNLVYQWRHNGVPLTNNAVVQGADSPQIHFLNPPGAYSGNYDVVITNAMGAVTSAVVQITIEDPVVQSSPQSQSVLYGANASFTISVTGTEPLSYQWKKDGIELSDSGNVSGTTTATLLITAATKNNEGLYTVVVTNSAGAVSRSASLTVLEPLIVNQPMSRTNVAGTEASFSVAAAGSAPLSYQWYKGTEPLSDDGRISGANEATLILSDVSAADIGSYSVVVGNLAGEVTSNPANLQVLQALTFTAHPVSQSVVAGGEATFSVTATGEPPITYQWQKDGVDLVNATQSVLTISGVRATNAGIYRVIVSSQSLSEPSNPASLVVRSDIQMVSHPKHRVVEAGSYATFHVVATSPNPLTYQWQRNSSDLPGATGSSLVLTDVKLTDSGAYRVLITGFDNTVISQTARLLVGSPGIYGGLFYEEDAARHHSSGAIIVKTTKVGGYSGKIFLDGNAVSFSGKFGIDGSTNRVVSRAKFLKEDLQVALELDVENQRLLGSIAGSTWVSSFIADPYTFSIDNPADGYTGTYTMVIPGFAANSDGPVGYGYSRLIVNTLGKISSAGYLPDGQIKPIRITPAIKFLSEDGKWPLYSQLYPVLRTNDAGKIFKEFQGSLIGWIDIASDAPMGTVSWTKTSWTNDFYSTGFTNLTQIIGSKHTYVPQARVLDMTAGVLSLIGGNLPVTIDGSFTYAENGAVKMTSTNDFVKISFNGKNGLFSGSFVHPENPLGGVTRIFGAVLQDQNVGLGFFLGTNQSGKVLLGSQ